MKSPSDFEHALETLERRLHRHPQAEVKNLERLRAVLRHHHHAAAMCKAITALLDAFPESKIHVIIEAELPTLGQKSRPEDIVAWIERVGVFVLEIKSHTIKGIRRFENNVPQVVYKGEEHADVDLLDQPKGFAYAVKNEMERVFEDDGDRTPPLYFAGWLPNVSPDDVARVSAVVADDKVWLSDMLEKDVFLSRIRSMKNISRGSDVSREGLERFASLFGTSSGLRTTASPQPTPVGSIRNLIDRKNLSLKRLTAEQEDIAFSPSIVKGPKVVRGVAGSGKSVVLANVVAETFLRELGYAGQGVLPFADRNALPEILVLCYNRTLVRYLSELIRTCFDARKPESSWSLPVSRLKIMNIDRYAHWLGSPRGVRFNFKDPSTLPASIEQLIKADFSDRQKYKHVFIDEGQDLDPAWFRLVREVAVPHEQHGRSIVVFYDDAQNIYGRNRPGTGSVPAWNELLRDPSEVDDKGRRRRIASSVMRVGHRNTNQILTLSFNLLLGAFADRNPHMKEFSNIAEYTKEIIPRDPSLNHPNAGKPSVEDLGDNQYRINFAVADGPLPGVHLAVSEDELLRQLVTRVKAVIDPGIVGVEPEDVLVMVPHRIHLGPVVSALKARSISVHVPVRPDEFVPQGTDPRDAGAFRPGCVTVSTIKSAKGYTAHVCHVAFVHALDGDDLKPETAKSNRAELHVACTRSSLQLDLWGLNCSLMREAEQARAALA